VATYLERDLRGLLDVGSLRDYERFLRACALRSAQSLNKAELARDVGISPSTAGSWLSVLEASNQVQLLEPWFANKTKSLVKSPKLYLCDTGLLCYLLGMRTLEDMLESPYAGAVWETFVCGELRKKLRSGDRGELFFWRDRTKEADFLIHKAGRFELLDAKWSEHPDARGATVLARVAAELPKGSVKRAALICRTRNAYPIRDKIQAVPVEEA
jgi:predicted AAA+ superfamily ATPase